MASFTVLTSACSEASIAYPVISGAKILNLSAQIVANYSTVVPEMYAYNHPSATLDNVSYCNITVTYTHPGENDTINTEIWAPLNNWNGRMQGVGGGGYVAGRFFLSYEFMAIALADGYVGVTTDAGISTDGTAITEPWAFSSPGQINLYALEDLAYVSLNDSAYIGKSVIKSLYGSPPKFSYFSGCSQGGRQGYALAQRYPDAYDGIAASAPAINWNEFVLSDQWPHLQMEVLGMYPRNCEMVEIVNQAIAACDGLDGVIDGVVSDVDNCSFDPFTVVGRYFNCSDTGHVMQLSTSAATIVNQTWAGPSDAKGHSLWYGPLRGAALAAGGLGTETIADTTCAANGSCTPSPNYLATDWIAYWLEKDPNFDAGTITLDQYANYFREGLAEYGSIIETNSPDLSKFKARGGKLIGYHGLVRIHSKGFTGLILTVLTG